MVRLLLFCGEFPAASSLLQAAEQRGFLSLLSADEPRAGCSASSGNVVLEELLLWETVSPSLPCLG